MCRKKTYPLQSNTNRRHNGINQIQCLNDSLILNPSPTKHLHWTMIMTLNHNIQGNKSPQNCAFTKLWKILPSCQTVLCKQFHSTYHTRYVRKFGDLWFFEIENPYTSHPFIQRKLHLNYRYLYRKKTTHTQKINKVQCYAPL